MNRRKFIVGVSAVPLAAIPFHSNATDRFCTVVPVDDSIEFKVISGSSPLRFDSIFPRNSGQLEHFISYLEDKVHGYCQPISAKMR